MAEALLDMSPDISRSGSIWVSRMKEVVRVVPRLQPNNDGDRRAYESGYDQGYQGSQPNRDANRNYNGQNAPNENLAARNGFQDGANDGLHDRQAGKSSRATKHKTYDHGKRGYDSSFGDKDQYKASYRQAYIQGYQ